MDYAGFDMAAFGDGDGFDAKAWIVRVAAIHRSTCLQVLLCDGSGSYPIDRDEILRICRLFSSIGRDIIGIPFPVIGSDVGGLRAKLNA